MQAPTQPTSSYRFGLFELEPGSRKLLRKGEPVRLQELPFRLLTLLLARAGEIVTREELRQSLWPEGTYVEFDGSLNAALKKLRFALGDDAENPIFIETVPRRGYRFIAPVECGRPEEISAAVSEPTLPLVSAGPSPVPRFPWASWTVAGVVVLLLLIVWKYTRKSQSGALAPRKVIAVLPFSNEGAGVEFDYLRYAIANDLVTDLTYSQSLNIRPFASTGKYGAQPFDPAAVGKELGVTHVLAGGFLRDQQNLRVNLELIDVAQNQAVWRDEVTVGPQELVSLHQKLAASATQRLLPAIDVPRAVADDIPSPKNEQGFDLFLHSTMVSLDPGPNLMAIAKLEQSVAVDPGYAPAWHQLAWRYYLDYHYGNGGEAALAKSLADYKRERQLDPKSEPWISLKVELGDLNGAYDEISDFLRRHPTSNAYFSMSYILRYAGLLDESRKECEAVLALDPVHGYRSCATPLIQSGDYAGAQKFIDLDAHSGYAATLRMHIALRTGNQAAALAESVSAAQLGYRNVDAKLARTCLSHPSTPELAKVVAEVEGDPVSSHDPELLYQNADALAFCEQPDAALRELSKAVKGNYCSYPAMDKDPLFDSIRQRPEFGAIRQAGIHCQENFLAHREQVKAALQAGSR
jgi:DNA-binding winged helix-turn-helix (wHTH) protein/TolB-like protein